MSRKSVLCIATSPNQADEIVDLLRTGGFSNKDVSALIPGKDVGCEESTKPPEAALGGVERGRVLGGAFEWLVGAAVLAIPGLGPLVAAGPILPALGGAAVGGISGALIDMGLPGYEASRFESKVKAGDILIAVHAENSDEMAQAVEIFEAVGAQEIATSREPKPPEPKDNAPKPEPVYERAQAQMHPFARSS
jgi:hypothetical protein